jgi:DNA-directed RNA polymerase subunit RPC12/RpoP
MSVKRPTSVKCGECKREFTLDRAYLVIDEDVLAQVGCTCIEQAVDEVVAFLCYRCADCLRRMGVEPDGFPNLQECIQTMDAMEAAERKLQ